MIKLIDPKRQAELEDVIVQLQLQVTQLTVEVQRLQEASRRNQRDIQKVDSRVQESYRPQTRYQEVNPWGTITKDDWERDFIRSAIPTRIPDEPEAYQRLRDVMAGTTSSHVGLDGTQVRSVRGTSGHTLLDDGPARTRVVSFMDSFIPGPDDE